MASGLRKKKPSIQLNITSIPLRVVADPRDGSVREVVCGGMNFLLGKADARWHHPMHQWGKGYGIIGRRPVCWDQPGSLRHTAGMVRADYDLGEGIRLRVQRQFGRLWRETYVWENTGAKAVEITCLALHTPFRDVYVSAADSLRRACHAHVWPGGELAWVWAEPMHGNGPGLGLRVTRGALWSYSIEDREHFTGSNIRGHILLHPTDHARNPGAFGGQPQISLPPDGSYELAWEIAPHANFEAFRNASSARFVRTGPLAVPTGKPVAIHLPGGKPRHIVSRKEGETWVNLKVNGRQTRVAVFHHAPLRRIVERRIDYILRHQQAASGAFVPVDTTTGLRIGFGAWNDWSDGRERVAMALLLQHARRLGWHRQGELDDALARFDRFVRRHLLTPAHEVREDSAHASTHRLYNFPWFAEFYLNQYRHTRRAADLDRSARILEAYYKNGGNRFLAFIECIGGVVDGLEKIDPARAGALRAKLLEHAEIYRRLGTKLPNHEVNYEQSMVAPLLMIYLQAHAFEGGRRWLAPIRNTLRWLEAFAGEQPHVRLRHIPIRHWDGFWFGRERMWGDVFPHYWSVLSAGAFLRHAAWMANVDGAGKADALRGKAAEIYHANLVHFHPDGSATCAYLMPGTIDHRPAHRADPVANDQDWALVWLLKDSSLLS